MPRKTISISAWLVGTVISFCVMFYLNEMPDPGNAGGYFARYTGGAGKVILQIYDARSGHIMAQRKYAEGYSFDLQWRADRVIYQTGGSTGYEEDYINLPPTYLDWLGARIF
jgi:hypothetical protein